jgi:hypothetical protein
MFIPKHLIQQIFAESETFRDYMIEQCSLVDNSISVIYDAVIKFIKDNADNKIAAIKAVREYSRSNPLIYKAFPSLEQWDGGCASLTSVKNLVVKYRAQFGIDG